MATIFEAGKTAFELRREREQRVTDAIHLKRTDRVPVICSLGYFVAKYVGIPCSAAYYDADVWMEAYRPTQAGLNP